MIDGDCPECGSSDYDRTGEGVVECGDCGFEYRNVSEDASDETPVAVPMDVARFDADLFKRVCNYLGEQGVLDRPNRTTRLVLDIRAGELVEVVEVEEEGRD